MGLLKKVLYKLAGTSEELQELYKEKGPCNEYVDAVIAFQKKPSDFDKIMNADLLISVERYAEAEEILNGIKIDSLLADDDIKGMGNFVLMNLYIHTGRREGAGELLRKHAKFHDIYFQSPSRKRYAIAYYDLAADIFSYEGNEKAAMNFLNLEKQWSQKYEPKFPIMPRISYVRILKNLNMEILNEEYENVKRFIEEYDGYERQWQKDSMLDLLEKAKTPST